MIGLAILAFSMLMQPIIRAPVSGVLLMGFSRIVAPPTFGAFYGSVAHDAPWRVGAAMIGLVIVLALQLVDRITRAANAA